MLKLQTIAYAIIAAAGLVCAAQPVLAQSKTLNDEPVSMIVQGNFTFTRTTAMNFGTYTVVTDTTPASTDYAVLTMSAADGSMATTPGTASSFTSVSATGRSRGIYAISGAAGSTAMDIAISDLQNLAYGGSGTPTPPDILLQAVTAEADPVTTAADGTATVRVGAELRTIPNTNQYLDGTYSGSFDITVQY
jgi:hypothetical protein